jgi:hypothetical protein
MVETMLRDPTKAATAFSAIAADEGRTQNSPSAPTLPSAVPPPPPSGDALQFDENGEALV